MVRWGTWWDSSRRPRCKHQAFRAWGQWERAREIPAGNRAGGSAGWRRGRRCGWYRRTRPWSRTHRAARTSVEESRSGKGPQTTFTQVTHLRYLKAYFLESEILKDCKKVPDSYKKYFDFSNLTCIKNRQTAHRLRSVHTHGPTISPKAFPISWPKISMSWHFLRRWTSLKIYEKIVLIGKAPDFVRRVLDDVIGTLL